MNGKSHFRIIRLVLVGFILLSPAIARGQDDNSEMRAFREELDARADVAEVSFEQCQETLSQLLDRKPKFNLWHWLSRFLASAGNVGDLRILNIILSILGGFALIAVVAFFVRQIRRHLINDAEEAPQSSEDSPITARAALDGAEQFETDGDFREALRSLYLAALRHLQERGFLSYDKSLTNHEYLRELNRHPNLRETLRPIIHTFDEVWYGYKTSDKETVTEYRNLLQKVYEVSR